MKPKVFKHKRTKKFKSKFEEAFANHLEKQGIAYDYEKLVVKYLREHTYKLDFLIESGKILIETKGYFTAADRQKMLDVKKHNPELDIRLIFMANQKLHRLSNTRYSDWCDKHGFKYAFSKEGHMPKEWLAELKNITKDDTKKVPKKEAKS